MNNCCYLLPTCHAESLFNAFATAAFFKFVVFSIFEMRYLLAIWKASRPLSNGEGWEAMRRELSVLYSRFCMYTFNLSFFGYLFSLSSHYDMPWSHLFHRISKCKLCCVGNYYLLYLWVVLNSVPRLLGQSFDLSSSHCISFQSYYKSKIIRGISQVFQFYIFCLINLKLLFLSSMIFVLYWLYFHLGPHVMYS